MISSQDEEAIRSLGKTWEIAWNTHDMRLLASLVTPGVDFVTVMGGWLSGRETFQKYHAGIHATQFKNATQRLHGMTIRPLTRDICVVHMNWTNAGDTDVDGTPRHPRDCLLTCVVLRDGSEWLIDVAHNTNINPQVVGSEYRKPTS